ncbi:MAG TPA: hypothetical protein VHO91_17300, partial [Rhodopila sp.]|nr:hypothetical protein [Rhodopila sp.]
MWHAGTFGASHLPRKPGLHRGADSTGRNTREYPPAEKTAKGGNTRMSVTWTETTKEIAGC